MKINKVVANANAVPQIDAFDGKAVDYFDDSGVTKLEYFVAACLSSGLPPAQAIHSAHLTIELLNRMAVDEHNVVRFKGLGAA